MSTETNRADLWCNCQSDTPNGGPWHPLGDTSFCPPGPQLIEGHNMRGERRIIQAEWPSGVRADWDRQVSIGVEGGFYDVERAREKAAELQEVAADILRAADWIEAHANELTGYGDPRS